MSDFASPTNSRRHEGVGGKGFQTEDTRGGNKARLSFMRCSTAFTCVPWKTV